MPTLGDEFLLAGRELAMAEPGFEIRDLGVPRDFLPRDRALEEHEGDLRFAGPGSGAASRGENSS